MTRRADLFVLFLLLACLISQVRGEVVYFLVAEANTPSHGDSYILPLTDPNAISHARDLIKYGPSAGEPIAVARIDCGCDGINRDYFNVGKRAWSWHVTEFVDFADMTAEVLDGWPGLVESNCRTWMNITGGKIGFWEYTVVAELGTDPKHWNRDFDKDKDVDFKDFNLFGLHWMSGDCNNTAWCAGADLDFSETVDFNDLRIFAEAWLSPFAAGPVWFDCWTNCLYQCYGDADCRTQNPPFNYRIYMNDLNIIVNIGKSCGWPCRYPNLRYNPCADFDRDLDVDDDDLSILESNLKKRDSDLPGPCQTCQ